MLVSLSVIFIILILGAIYSKGTISQRNSDKNRRSYIFFISIILILQSALRHVTVGADTGHYLDYFNAAKYATWSEVFHKFIEVYKFGEGKDPGYSVFEKLISSFTNEYQILLFVIALMFFYALGRFIYLNTYKLNHAVLAFVIYSVLFYAFFSITGHRQTIATAAALYSFEWIKKRKLFPFVLVLLVFSTIHKSVLIFIPFYFIGNIKQTKLIYKISLVLFPFLMISRNQISYFFKVLGGYDIYGVNTEANTFTFTVLYFLIMFLAYNRMKYVLKIHKNSRYYYNALAIGLLFIPLTWVNPSAMRVVQYFSIFMLIIIPFSLESFKIYSLKVQRAVIGAAILILLFFFIKSNININYYFFWENV